MITAPPPPQTLKSPQTKNPPKQKIPPNKKSPQTKNPLPLRGRVRVGVHPRQPVLFHLLGSSSLALQRQHGLRQPPPDNFAVFGIDFDPDRPPLQIRRRP